MSTCSKRSTARRGLIDRIRFDAPVGLIGRLVERALLASYLHKLIAVRGEYLKVEAERRHRAATSGP